MGYDNAIRTYATYSKNNELRRQSSSGAIFTLLAEKIFQQGGVVYGVAMSEDCYYVEFIRVTNKDDLSRLRGSKYLQAKVGRTFQRVKADLEAGIEVLFSGTSCQVNGLKSFLGRDYDNLYCVDVICHGVPSPKLWRKYAEYVEEKNKAKLVSVNFRCKDYGWSDFGIKQIDQNHEAIYISKDKDPYMLMFLRDYALRPSCYECVTKKSKLADLTIADFWGIDRVLPDMNDGKGVSLVIIRTKKGEKIYDQISADTVSKKVSYEEAIKGNPAEYSSAKRPPEREYFFEDMSAMEFEKLKDKYAVPSSVSLINKVKKLIKKILIKTPIWNFGRGRINSFNYGLLFTLEKEKRTS